MASQTIWRRFYGPLLILFVLSLPLLPAVPQVNAQTAASSQNYALSFGDAAGSNDYVSFLGEAGRLPAGNSARTLEFWAKSYDAMGQAAYHNSDHLVNWGSAADNQAFGSMLYTGNTWWFYANNADLYDVNTGITANTDWHFHSISYDGTAINYYLDGVLLKTENRTLQTVGDNLFFGTRPDNDGYNNFNGVLDEVRIWNTVRSPSQIQAGKNIKLQGSEPGIVGYWSFDENGGQVIKDNSANALDGILGSADGVDSNDAQWVLSDIILQDPSMDGSMDYIALGDSVAAGHGLTDNLTTEKDYSCRRSLDKSYPAQLKSLLEARGRNVVNFMLLACSGATTRQQDGHKWFKNQVEDAVKFLNTEHTPGRPTLLTISIGANDIPWTKPAGICGLLNQQTKGQFEKNIRYLTESIVKELNGQIKLILEASRDSSVVVSEYYNPYNERSVVFQVIRYPTDFSVLFCIADGTRRSDNEMYRRTEYIVEQVNLALAADVVYANNKVGQLGYGRLDFAGGIRNKFKDHQSPGKRRKSDVKGECGYTYLPSTDASQVSNYTWVQYPTDSESFARPTEAASLAPYSVVTDPKNWKGDCFHPNITGSLEIAKSVNEAAIRIQRVLREQP